MSSGEFVDEATVAVALDEFDAAYTKLANLPLDAVTPAQLLAMSDRLEIHQHRQPALEHRVLAELRARTTPEELGAKNWRDVLSNRLRISRGEAGRRLDESADLGPRHALTGEALEPHFPNVARAQAAGLIGAEHVRIIRKFFADLPDSVDRETRGECEKTLARVATDLGPDGLRKAAARLAAFVNPDGKFSDAERERRRHLIIGPQQCDGLSRVNGLLDPEARATIDAVFAKLAAPGMCNPADETPCVDGTPSHEAIESDTRSPGQRNHDALTAMGRALLASGELGQHNGLPVSIVVSTTLKELESGAGVAVTGGGTLLPMSTLIRMASHSYHYLTVFNNHTEIPLYLGRSRRTASAGQRIVLYAKDRGCTRPGCTVGGYWCQVHHAVNDWADDGQTDISDLTLGCPYDNRLVKPGGWRTRKRKDGTTEWIPPPHLDTGQARVNDYHHPERYLVEPDDEDDDPPGD